MKINMMEHGVLEIRPETPIEVYALRKWCNENIHDSTIDASKMVIYLQLAEDLGGQKWMNV